VNLCPLCGWQECKGGGLYVLNTTRLSLLDCSLAHNLHQTNNVRRLSCIVLLMGNAKALVVFKAQ
jgi:hypothetical protein